MHCLILGGAANVWDDLWKLESMLGHPWDGMVIVVNAIGFLYPDHPLDHAMPALGGYRAWLKETKGIIDTAPRPVHHWTTLHPEKMRERKALRLKYHKDMPKCWAHSDNKREIDEAITPSEGSSTMTAVRVANKEGATRKIVCGAPMQTGHHADRFDRKGWTGWSHFRKWWEDEKNGVLKDTRSMSGWTRDLLGEPSPRWLNEARRAA